MRFNRKTIIVLFLVLVIIFAWTIFFYKLFFSENYINTTISDNETQKSLLDINNSVTWDINNNSIIDTENKEENSKFINKLKKAKEENTSINKTNKNIKNYREKNLNFLKLISNLQKKPYSTNWYYYWIIYGIWIEQEWWLELTDIIKLVVYNESTKNLVMIWIPRDWVIEYDWEKMKINYIYNKIISSWKFKWKELEQLTKALSKFFDIQLNYYIKVDFDLFKEFIDTIWWIRSCVDKDYYEWKKLVLEKWCYKLDWETALLLARTRKQDNDFFRSLRQNIVLYSIIDKVKSLSIKDIIDTSKLFLERVETNLNLWEIIYVWNNMLDLNKKIWIALNSECNFYDWFFTKDMLFCLFYEWYDRTFYLYPIKDVNTIRHYIKTLIYHPDIVWCEFNWILNYKEKINLLNVWVKIEKHKIENKFIINSLSWCNIDDINYFIDYE